MHTKKNAYLSRNGDELLFRICKMMIIHLIKDDTLISST